MKTNHLILWFALAAFQFMSPPSRLRAAEAAAVPQSPPASRTNSPGGAARQPAGGDRVPTLDELFETLDTNHDGKISKEEATARYAPRFPQWDANGDGFATRQEIHDYRLSIGFDDNGQRTANSTSSAGDNRGLRRVTATATILKEPADWRLETMSIPPGFAPDIQLTGAEEIRFAPGMFNTAAGDYFTCVIAITANGTPELGAPEIKDFLEKYYRGLSSGRAQRTGTKSDAAQMKAIVNPAAGAEAKNRFEAQVDFFDSFSDGRKITLNVEAQVIAQPAAKKTCLLLLVSPSAKESAAWKTLRDIGRKTAMNVP